jgi:hypothetical protein
MTLERDLRALAAGFPEPPALAPGVSAAIVRASRRRRRRRVVVLALALFLLVPATVLAVSPDLRQRVLETFGLRNAKVEVVEQLPPAAPAVPGDVRGLQLGSLITLQQARNELRLHIDPPTALGRPDAIYAGRLKTGTEVSLLYEPRTVAARLGVRTRVIVSVLRGTFNADFLGKMVTKDNRVTRLKIGSDDALLITGGPLHLVFFRRAGAFDETRGRLAGTTLLWQRRALLVRIEGELSGARLLAIARSLSTG